MKEINVNFVQQSGKNSEVTVPDAIVVEDALEQLIDLGELKPLDPKQYWVVTFKETGDGLDMSKTLAENGVKDGISLNVIRPAVD